MAIQEQLNDDWKAAMRSGDTLRRDTLSGLRAAVKNAAIEARVSSSEPQPRAGTGNASPGTPLDDVAVMSVIEREAKKRRDAIEEYEKAGRADRAAAERAELDILQEYLPQQMNDAELETVVAAVIAETGAAGPADMGRLMKALMPRVQGRADGKRVNEVVRRLLQP
jgi:uncharacterized protein YqeY